MPPRLGREHFSVLVIGRDESLRHVTAEAIRDLDCTVVEVDELPEGLDRLRGEHFNAALIEFAEPQERLLDCLELIRNAQPETKVVLIVDRSTTQDVIDAIRGKAFSLFSRPFEPDAAAKMLRHAVQVHQWSDDIELISAVPVFLSVRLRCTIDTADRLVQFSKEMPVDLPGDERLELADALREMLMNAIEHGGKLNPSDWVRVSRVRTMRTVVYHIQDPGKGFLRDPLPHAAVMNPEDDPIAHMQHRLEAGMRPGGFGMLIASKLVDEVIYNESGNEVILIKHLD